MGEECEALFSDAEIITVYGRNQSGNYTTLVSVNRSDVQFSRIGIRAGDSFFPWEAVVRVAKDS